MPPRTYTSRPVPGDDEVISTKGLEFTLDDVTFTCDGVFDQLDMADLASSLMDSGPSWLDPEALGAVGQLFKTIMGEETYRAFRRHRHAHRTPPKTIAAIMQGLIEDLTDRPTNRPSVSPGGPQKTAGSSTAASPSPGRHARPAKAPSPLPEGMPAGDLIQAPPPDGPPPAEPPTRRVINLGDKTRTRVQPAG